MEDDRVRRSASGRHALAVDRHARARPRGAERDGRRPSSAASRFEPSPTTATLRPSRVGERERVLQLRRRLGTCEQSRGPTGAECRVPRERHVALDVQASASSSAGTASVDVAGADGEDVSPRRARPASQRRPRRGSASTPPACRSERRRSRRRRASRSRRRRARAPRTRRRPQRRRRRQARVRAHARDDACASRGAAGTARARARRRSRAPSRSSPRSRSDGARSRRTREHRLPRREARTAARRP